MYSLEIAIFCLEISFQQMLHKVRCYLRKLRQCYVCHGREQLGYMI